MKQKPLAEGTLKRLHCTDFNITEGFIGWGKEREGAGEMTSPHPPFVIVKHS